MNEINFELRDVEAIDLTMGMGIKKVYPPIENLEVIPTKEQQIFNHENSYGYDEVIVEPIPDEYIIPDGTLPITENATYDVRRFARVSTAVKPAPVLQDKELTINENGTHDITYDEGYDGLNQVSVTVDAIEDLSEELDVYHNEVTEQEATIDTILKTLQHKAISGGTNEPDKPVVEPDYITDGLVAWWEGCDDLDDSNHWCSRVGDDYIYVYTSTPSSIHSVSNNPATIKTKDAYRNNMVYTFLTNKDYHNQGYTFEVVGKVNLMGNSTAVIPTSTTGATLLSFNRNLSPVIQVYGDNATFGVFNSRIMENITKKYVNCVGKRHKYTISLDKLPVRVNGQNATYGEHQISYCVNGDNWNTNNLMTLGGTSKGANLTILCYYKEEYITNGEISSIRIYNRKLTEEELKHNYEIDKARFEIDDYETA